MLVLYGHLRPGRGAARHNRAALRDRLAARGVEGVPNALVEPDDLDAHWRSPNLLFSQTCGRPYATGLRDAVVLLGVPHYDAPGCEGPRYRSVFVVRDSDEAVELADLPGRTAAVNDLDSHSGFAQLTKALAPFFKIGSIAARPVMSGGHLRSLALVRQGKADFAAIDCVTWAIAARDEPGAIEGLRIVGLSPASLGLPFIASGSLPPQVVASLRDALVETVSDPDLSAVCKAHLFSGLSAVAPHDYDGHG